MSIVKALSGGHEKPERGSYTALDPHPCNMDALPCSKEDVLSWLLEADVGDAVLVFESLVRERPELFALLGTALARCRPPDVGVNVRSSVMTSVPVRHHAIATSARTSENSSQTANAPLLRLSSEMYFCSEGEPTVQIEVQRVGNLTSESAVWITTRDATAAAGCKYEALSERLTFAIGDWIKNIDIKLMASDRWDTTTAFEVELLSDEITNAVLDKYLWHADVVIIDEDNFPSNRFKTEIQSGNITAHLDLLALEFFRMVWADPFIACGMVKRFFVEQLKNVMFITFQWVSLYMINVVLHDHDRKSHTSFNERVAGLHICVAVSIAPFAVLHYFDYQRLSYGIGGKLRRLLHTALLTKFLSQDNKTRSETRSSDILWTVAHDANTVVRGLNKVFSVFRLLGRIFMILAFQTFVPHLFGHQVSWLPTVAFLTLAIPLLVVRLFRKLRALQAVQEMCEAQSMLVEYAVEAVNNYRLIVDFRQRPAFLERYDSQVRAFNASKRASNQFLLNNVYLMGWVGTLVTAFYTVWCGCLVIRGSMSLGVFVVGVRNIHELGLNFTAMISEVMSVVPDLSVLARIVRSMNLPSDLDERLLFNRYCRACSERNSDKEIRVTNLVFSHHRGAEDIYNLSSTLRFSTMEFEIGRLICLVGDRGRGKTTLLNLIVGAHLPNMDQQNCGLFVPSHLRILPLSSAPFFFHGTLRDNLSFGVTAAESDGSISRIVSICTMLGVSEQLINLVQSDVRLQWHYVLSRKQLQLLNFARALIANPDVLCIHHIDYFLSASSLPAIIALLKDFVEERGLQQDAGSKSMRTPRTCIFTSHGQISSELVDHFIQIECNEVATKGA